MFTLLNTNWYSIFYWVTVADSVNNFLLTLAIICTIATGLSIIGLFWTSSEMSSRTTESESYKSWQIWNKSWKRLMNFTLVPALIFGLAVVFTPTKKDCLFIVAGGAIGNFVTTDSSSKALPADMTKYFHLALKDKISDLSAETRQELGMSTPKEDFLQKLKGKVSEEVIDALSKDTTIKIVK